jgi:nucleotide-binding universal stress UspA family protein
MKILHGKRGLDRLILGSVSDSVARHAPCSVEIVRAAPNAA